MNKNLYRGKRKDTLEWVKGDLVLHGHDELEGRMWIVDKFSLSRYEVIPETVGQCTGCPDMYGNDVYEDDIIILIEEVKKIFNVKDGIVKYGRGGFYIDEFGTLNSLNVLASYDWVLRGKIIGNIHDNPELLSIYNKEV